MGEQNDIFDELVAKIVTEGKKVPLESVTVNEDGTTKKKVNNSLLIVNELVKTRNEFAIKNAELDQKYVESEIKKSEVELKKNEIEVRKIEQETKQKELDLEKEKFEFEKEQAEKDLKIRQAEQINEGIKNVGGIAVSAGGLLAFGVWLKKVMSFEEAGHMFTSTAGRTLLSCMKIFKK